MEREPQRPKYFAEYNGEQVVFSPENCIIYCHYNSPQYDHLFITVPKEEGDETQMGFYVWRWKHGTRDQRLEADKIYQQMVTDLEAEGCDLLAIDNVSKFDKDAYMQSHDYVSPSPRDIYMPLRRAEIVNPEEQPTTEYFHLQEELTPRQERLAEFVAYLLLHERLAIEEFQQTEGELYI